DQAGGSTPATCAPTPAPSAATMATKSQSPLRPPSLALGVTVSPPSSAVACKAGSGSAAGTPLGDALTGSGAGRADGRTSPLDRGAKPASDGSEAFLGSDTGGATAPVETTNSGRVSANGAGAAAGAGASAETSFSAACKPSRSMK